MKILFVSNQFPSPKYPFKGTFIYTQANEIQKQIDELVVLAPNYGHEKKFSKFKGLKIHRFASFTKPTSDPLLRNLFRGITGLISLPLFIISQTISIINIVKKEQINLIHAHWILPSGFSSYLASIITRRKFVITTNGSDLTYCGKNNILKKFICFVLSKTALLICVSDQLNLLANELCNTQVNSDTVLIGIPKSSLKDRINLIKTSSSNNKEKTLYRLVCVGSLYPVKGINFLLEGLKILSEKRSDFFLDVVGGGENLDEYNSYIKDNNLSNFIKFHGFKNHQDTLDLIINADIAVQASISEGLSVFIQESVFYGKAIVATDVGGTKEIVKDGFNGFLIEPRNPVQIAERIDFLLSNPDKISSFGVNSLKIADEKLLLEKNMKKVINLYKTILKK